VALLWRTTPPEARADYLRNAPAYDPDPAARLGPLQPRDRLGRCPGCAAWIAVRAASHPRVYCSYACRKRAHYRRHRARIIARVLRAYRARRAREAA
jgi:hypothetical protein